MASLNRVMLIGHLGRDPETRAMGNGDSVCNIAVATTESWKDKSSGERKEATEWHRVVLYRKLAEIAGEYLRKGAQVYIEGSMKSRTWTDKDGVERVTTEIIATDMRMLGAKPEGQGQQRGQQDQRSKQAPQSNRQQSRPAQNFDNIDDDIPFDNPYKGKYSYAV